MMCNKFGNNKRLRTHKIVGYVENERVTISSDIIFKTDVHVQYNKPDLVVFDKKENETITIEVGDITGKFKTGRDK